MRRWNGWGDERVTYPVPPGARRLLGAAVGPGERPRDATLPEVVARVPPSRLPPHPLVSVDAEQRVRHALGQSLPDWIAARSGRIPAFPDGVAYPATPEEVLELLRFAAASGARLIPYGGGTSVVGHLTVPPGEAPVLSVDLDRLSRLIRLDERSALATFGAGVRGPELEASLRARGWTLGHYPQSFEYSTLGGWVATRSAGQQSIWYGRIEDLFAGGVLEAPAGTVTLPPWPASAAGPDLRHLVLGSEGRLGILTEVTVRVRRLPEAEAFAAVFFPAFEPGLEAMRALAQAEVGLSMVRLSTPGETATTLAMAGHERALRLLERWVALRGAGPDKCLLILGATGWRSHVRRALARALAICADHRGVYAGRTFGREWVRQRFRAPYLRNTLWEMGYAVDTLETAGTWVQVPGLVTAVERALQGALEAEGERVYVFTHLSHVYRQGSNVYTTYLFRLAPDPEVNLRRWRRLKEAASRAIVAAGGTVSHQHGEVTGLLQRRSGAVEGVAVRDRVSGRTAEVRARVVINAAGAWADALRGQVGRPPRLRQLRGSHLLFPGWRVPLATGLNLFHPRDGRPLYVLPWEGMTLVGTTDVDHGDGLDDEPRIHPDEGAYLLEAVQHLFPALDLEARDVVATFAGVRPVVGSGKADPSREPRDWAIWDEGLVTVTGGKLTTFGAMARAAMAAARRRLPDAPDKRPTEESGSHRGEPARDAAEALASLDETLRRRLLGRYGHRTVDLVRRARPGELELVPGTTVTWAELRWAIEEESVVHLDDLLLRRVRLGLQLPQGGAAMLPRLRPLAQESLGWDDARWEAEASRYRQLWAWACGPENLAAG
ncbi:FAD-binding protein [Geochorda subterranea]|uniref:FAD-binding protein n=1 Tax=Geochorda subterranea TaxID=3109564 RepID=A0ABZ1BNW8_9FIRM|nr:FAD-binding protein [Limnochorda sp. LNt]WRP14492.1 FAD-binding protein [Limnochorda sp. LNt]